MDYAENLTTRFDDTTVFGITEDEDGDILKKRRRKSLGRRVSFAEAPSLHIFPRDDEYETPTRVKSPHAVGERRSPRLAARRHNNYGDDNQPVARRRKKAKPPFKNLTDPVVSPALKREDWLDTRDSSPRAGSNYCEDNTGPVDLRHLSFDPTKYNDMDDENLTLDSTTFALKFSQQHSNPIVIGPQDGPSATLQGDGNLEDGTTDNCKIPLPAIDETLRDDSSEFEARLNGKNVDDDTEGELDGPPSTENDMSFTTIRPLRQAKCAVELPTGIGESNSDMSITMQVPRGKRMSFVPPENGEEAAEPSPMSIALQRNLDATETLDMSISPQSLSLLARGDLDLPTLQSESKEEDDDVDIRMTRARTVFSQPAGNSEEICGRNCEAQALKKPKLIIDNSYSAGTNDRELLSVEIVEFRNESVAFNGFQIPRRRDLLKMDTITSHSPLTETSDIPTAMIPRIREILEADRNSRNSELGVTCAMEGNPTVQVPQLRDLVALDVKSPDSSLGWTNKRSRVVHLSSLAPPEHGGSDVLISNPEKEDGGKVDCWTFFSDSSMEIVGGSEDPTLNARNQLQTQDPKHILFTPGPELNQGQSTFSTHRNDPTHILTGAQEKNTLQDTASTMDTNISHSPLIETSDIPTASIPQISELLEADRNSCHSELGGTCGMEGNPTVQVPQLRDLVAVDVNSPDSAPGWTNKRSSVAHLSSLAPTAHGESDVVLISNPEKEDGGKVDCWTSFSDSSMEIVGGSEDPTLYARNQSQTQDPQHILLTPGPEPNQGESTFSTHRKDPTHILAGALEKNTLQDTPSTTDARDPTHILVDTQEKDAEEDSPSSMDITAPTHMVTFAQQDNAEQGTPTMNTRDSTHIRQGKDYEQNYFVTMDSIQPTLILTTNQEQVDKQSSPSTMERISTTCVLVSTVERDYKHSFEESETMKTSNSLEKELATELTKSQVEDHDKDSLEMMNSTHLLNTVGQNFHGKFTAQDKNYEWNSLAMTEAVINNSVNTRENGSHDSMRPWQLQVASHTMSDQYTAPQEDAPEKEIADSTDILKCAEENLLLAQDVAPEDVDTVQPHLVRHKQTLDNPPFNSDPEQVEPASRQAEVPFIGGEAFIVRKMSVEEFLRLAEIQFSCSFQSPNAILKDPSLSETYQIKSVSEGLNFSCIIQPQIAVMEDACLKLREEVEIINTSVKELEEKLTASNPPFFSCFQKSGQCGEQMINQLGVLSSRLLMRKAWRQFRHKLEQDLSSRLMDMKNLLLDLLWSLQGARTTFEENHRRGTHLLSQLSSKAAAKGSDPISSVDAQNEVDLKWVEDLNDRLQRLETSQEPRLAKLNSKAQVAEDKLQRLEQVIELSKNRNRDLLNQFANNIRTTQSDLMIDEIASNPSYYLENMKKKIYLLQILQDGWETNATRLENKDTILELSYRSLVKRRYVVRKAVNIITVIRSSWTLDSPKIDKMFPGLNASKAFWLTLVSTSTTDGEAAKFTNLSSSQMFPRLRRLEAAHLTPTTMKIGEMPESKNLRTSMQEARILVGNLMDLMDEARRCQRVVNASCGGGVLVEPKFLSGSDGQPQLRIHIIDCFLYIEFNVILDMSSLPLSGYPFGTLVAEVEMTLCPPAIEHLFKAGALESALAVVKSGYNRLERMCEVVGSLLASVRKDRNIVVNFSKDLI